MTRTHVREDVLAPLAWPGRQRWYRALRRNGYPSYGAYALTAYRDPPLLWFRITKVATRTILEQLRLNGLDQRERYALRYPVNRFDGYFAFAFVRNPWDRLVSCWSHWVVRENRYGFSDAERARMQHFPAFVEHLTTRDLTTGDLHLRLQTQQIDLNRVDYLGRFESLEDDLAAVFDRLGLRLHEGIHRNRSGDRADFRSYYDDRTAELVGELYALDVHRLGYRFEPGGSS